MVTMPADEVEQRTAAPGAVPGANLQLEESASFDRQIIHYIQRAAATGLYEIRGLGAKRRLPHFDDLVFLGASLSRYPLEGYREKCSLDDRARHAFRQAALEARNADHDRRHELRRAVGQRQGGARARCDREWAPRPRPAMAA